MTEAVLSWLQPASSTLDLLVRWEVSTNATGADTVLFQCNNQLCQVEQRYHKSMF
jgi:hypothetical protein